MFHPPTHRLAVQLGAGVLALVALSGAAPALGAASADCGFEQQYLPHTADAVDGWYHSCNGG
jgi:hypothetical protein